MRHTVLTLLILLLTTPAWSQVQLEILDPANAQDQGDPAFRADDNNFRLAGTYGFSVSYENNNVYRLFATTGHQRMTWYNNLVYDTRDGVTDFSTGQQIAPEICLDDDDPRTWDARCLEQIGLYWKYDECTGFPCKNNGRWNAHPVTPAADGNISAFPVQYAWFTWPRPFPGYGVEGLTPILTRHDVNTPALCGAPGESCPPPTSYAVKTACHPDNPGAYASGVANPKVVQVYYGNGQRRWFMAFNSMVHANASRDRFRVAWAQSADGKTWDVYPTFLFRSANEAVNVDGTCRSTGFLVTDMFIDSGHFYVLFTEVTKNTAGQPSDFVHMVRSRIPNPPTASGFTTWELATLPLVNGRYQWQTVSIGGQLDMVALDAASILPAQHGRPGGVVKQAAVGRVFNTAGTQSRYIALTADRRSTGPVLQVWKTDSLDKPFSCESEADISSVAIGANGLEFGFTHYPDNLPGTPRLVEDQLDLWIVQNMNPQGWWLGHNTVTRRTARLHGDIYGPHDPGEPLVPCN